MNTKISAVFLATLLLLQSSATWAQGPDNESAGTSTVRPSSSPASSSDSLFGWRREENPEDARALRLLSRKELEERVDSGDPKAMRELGFRYSKAETDYPFDRDRAVKLFEAAMGKGDREAKAALGCRFFRENKENKVEGERLLREAADAGSAYAQGELLLDDFFISRTAQEQQEFEAQVNGVNDLQFLQEVGEIYVSKLGVYKTKRPEGINLLEWLDSKGVVKATFHLGTRYLWSPETRAEGVNLIKKAAEQGYADARHQLALLYLYGYEVGVNWEEGRRLLAQAVEQNNPSALQDFAVCLIRGDFGIEPNPTKGLDLLKQAAEDETQDAALFNLAVCYLKGKGTEQNGPEGERILRELIQRPQCAAHAHKELALALLYGIGIQQNEQEGLSLLAQRYEPELKALATEYLRKKQEGDRGGVQPSLREPQKYPPWRVDLLSLQDLN